MSTIHFWLHFWLLLPPACLPLPAGKQVFAHNPPSSPLNLRGPLLIINLSLPSRRESSNLKPFWIPAFAGMTFLEVALRGDRGGLWRRRRGAGSLTNAKRLFMLRHTSVVSQKFVSSKSHSGESRDFNGVVHFTFWPSLFHFCQKFGFGSVKLIMAVSSKKRFSIALYQGVSFLLKNAIQKIPPYLILHKMERVSPFSRIHLMHGIGNVKLCTSLKSLLSRE
jgi:hypothetical protein